MTVLILANLDVGLYKFRKELIIELKKRGYKVYVALPNGEYIDSIKNLGCKFINVEVDRRGINPLTDIQLLRKYSYIINRVNPDLVVTYTIKPNIYGGIASLLHYTDYSVNITGLGTAFQKKGLVRFMVVNMYRIALLKAKNVFFENTSNMEEFAKYKICNKNRMYVLNGAGVNTKEFSYLEYSNNKKFKFLFIGRVMKEKGIDELFLAIRKLIKEGNDVLLDIVGPCEENYEEVLRRYENEGWLNYYGYQDDVKPFIASCDCFVLPSWHEGMANTNLECASSGRPIITTNIPGCKEAIINNCSGFLCEKKDAESLYECMKKMISTPISQRIEMGKMGRKHMIKVFDKSEVVNKTINKLFER